MPLNRGCIGKEYPPGEPYLVSAEKIREFAAAIGDPNPAYRDVTAARALGYEDVIAPPTFPFALTRDALEVAMFDPELSMDYSRVVHGEQSFRYVRPVRAGDRLVTRARIADIRTAGRNEILVHEADLCTDDGALVVSTVATIISRGTAATGEGAPA